MTVPSHHPGARRTPVIARLGRALAGGFPAVFALMACLVLSVAAARPAHADDVTIRGSYSEKNIDKLFGLLQKHRGKVVAMKMRIALPEKGSRYDVRLSHCWLQIVDKKSGRVIELFNTQEYQSGPVSLEFADAWEIQNTGKGKRSSSCGDDPEGVEAPSAGYTYFLSPVG